MLLVVSAQDGLLYPLHLGLEGLQLCSEAINGLLPKQREEEDEGLEVTPRKGSVLGSSVCLCFTEQCRLLLFDPLLLETYIHLLRSLGAHIRAFKAGGGLAFNTYANQAQCPFPFSPLTAPVSYLLVQPYILSLVQLQGAFLSPCFSPGQASLPPTPRPPPSG